MFQTGSHEIWGSVAARTFRAVVTTSMFMIWSGIPLPAAEMPKSVEPGRSQRDIAALVAIDRDGRAERDAHLIGAARNVEQHQEVLTELPSCRTRTAGGCRFDPRLAVAAGVPAMSEERRAASSARLTCCGR